MILNYDRQVNKRSGTSQDQSHKKVNTEKVKSNIII